MDVSRFKLEMVYHQTTAFDMQDLHARAIAVDEDERISVLDIAAHLIGDYTAQGIEALSHIRRMRIQEEPVGVVKTEHGYLFIISNCPSVEAAISPDRRTVIPLGNTISQLLDCIMPGCPPRSCCRLLPTSMTLPP